MVGGFVFQWMLFVSKHYSWLTCVQEKYLYTFCNVWGYVDAFLLFADSVLGTFLAMCLHVFVYILTLHLFGAIMWFVLGKTLFSTKSWSTSFVCFQRGVFFAGGSDWDEAILLQWSEGGGQADAGARRFGRTLSGDSFLQKPRHGTGLWFCFLKSHENWGWAGLWSFWNCWSPALLSQAELVVESKLCLLFKSWISWLMHRFRGTIIIQYMYVIYIYIYQNLTQPQPVVRWCSCLQSPVKQVVVSKNDNHRRS